MNKELFNKIFDEAIKWSLYAIVFAAPFSKSISEIGITVAIVIWALKRLINRDLQIKNIELITALAVYVITIIPSFINSDYFALSLKALFTKVLKYVFLCIVMTDALRTRERIMDILKVAVISMTVITVDGFVQYYLYGYDILHNYPAFTMRAVTNHDGFFRGYPTASFPYPNDLAAWILLMIIPLACVSFFGMKRSLSRYFTGILSFLMMYLFFLAKVRGALIALAVSVGYIVISKRKLWILLIPVIILTGVLKINTEMARNLYSMNSIGDRLNMLGTSWEIFKKHPIIGNGLNTFFVNFKKYRNDEWKDKKGSYAHNCYLQMAADTGIVGLSGFLFLLFSYFSSVIKAAAVMKDNFLRTALWGISIGVFAFLVHSFFDTNLYSLNLVTLFWFAIGTSLAIVRLSKTATI